MKNKIFSLVLFGVIISTANCADLMFQYKNKMVNLTASYDSNDVLALNGFYQLFSGSIDKDSDTVCIKKNNEDSVLSTLEKLNDLNNYLSEGLFEDHSIRSAISSTMFYPINLKLVDEPNELDVGSLNVRFCM